VNDGSIASQPVAGLTLAGHGIRFKDGDAFSADTCEAIRTIPITAKKIARTISPTGELKENINPKQAVLGIAVS
jgi:hypothetical protein